MREKNVWNGEYKGIGFEIQNFKIEGTSFSPLRDCWTFYLYLNLEQIPEELHRHFWLRKKKSSISERTFYNYSSTKFIPNIDFHGGCTWYSKESGMDGDPKVIKIGCDYQHLWDDGHRYTVDWVKKDVETAIESFFELVPNVKFRCSWTGKYFEQSERVEIEGYHGVISKEGAQKREEYMDKNKVKP